MCHRLFKKKKKKKKKEKKKENCILWMSGSVPLFPCPGSLRGVAQPFFLWKDPHVGYPRMQKLRSAAIKVSLFLKPGVDQNTTLCVSSAVLSRRAQTTASPKKVGTSLGKTGAFLSVPRYDDVLPCHVHLPVYLRIMDPHSRAPKNNSVTARCYASHTKTVTNKEVKQSDHTQTSWTCKETQTAVVWTCLPLIRSGQDQLSRHSKRGKKTRQTEEEVGRQNQGMDRPGVYQVSECSGE